MASVVEGLANFSHTVEPDQYMGQTKYSITLTLSEDDANTLASNGVKIKDYEGNKQRKFSSKYQVSVIDADGEPYGKEIPYNSKVRVKFKYGPAHPVHGVSTYLDAVRVLEEAEAPVDDTPGF